MLQQLGYTNVRDYRGGLADWVESGGPVETATAPMQSQAVRHSFGPELLVSTDGLVGRGPARLSRGERWNKSLLDLIGSVSTLQLFLIWSGAVLLSGVGYWLGALIGDHGLLEGGKPLSGDLHGLGSAIYFSFVTATSVGYGDIVPVGAARAIAVTESVTALLVFGAVVAKFVSHRQDVLMEEIHRVTFDERLDRVQTNLHIVIEELLALASFCDNPTQPLERLSRRLDSAGLLFQGELRTIHDLLYQPRLMVEEGVLASILANLCSALETLVELLGCLPSEFVRSPSLKIVLNNVARLSEDICGNCVPHAYTPRLIFWMDRIQHTSEKIR